MQLSCQHLFSFDFIMHDICLSLISFLQRIQERVSRQKAEELGSPVGSEPLSAYIPAWLQCFLNVFSFNCHRCTCAEGETKKENKTTGGYSSCQNTILLARIPGPLTDQRRDPGWLLGTTSVVVSAR